MNLYDLLPHDGTISEVVAVIRNPPPASLLHTYEAARLLLEGTEKKWGDGYTSRLDRRAPHHGGDQIHIRGPQGKAWAYRSTGTRSEPTKYTLAANDKVIDIVRKTFDLSTDIRIESQMTSVTDDQAIVEVMFCR